jgi:hypothetical protein
MELKFTPRRIKELEDRIKMPFTTLFNNFSIADLAQLVACGMNIDTDKALDELEKHFDEGGDMVNLFLTIMETLQTNGFLPKALSVEDLRAKMNNPEMMRQMLQNFSGNLG